MNVNIEGYKPLLMYASPASIPQIVAHIQDYLIKNPIVSIETIAQIIVQALQEHPELLNGSVIPISEDSEQSIKEYIDALPQADGYTKAEINLLLTGKQDTLTFDQTPTPGSSNPVTSSGIIAAMSALQSSLETMINLKADAASTYTKTQVDTKLLDKANVADVYSKNTMDAKLLEINTDISGIEDDIDKKADIPVIVSVTVDTNGASMSAADQAKLTTDMVMCWYTGDRLKLTPNLSITPGSGTAIVAGTASESTIFTIAFIHSANMTSKASVISSDTNILAYTIDSTGVGHLTGSIGTIASTGTYKEILADVISKIDTQNRLLQFNIIASSSGNLNIFGYLYANKNFGAGFFTRFNGRCDFWNISDGTLHMYTIQKTEEV